MIHKTSIKYTEKIESPHNFYTITSEWMQYPQEVTHPLGSLFFSGVEELCGSIHATTSSVGVFSLFFRLVFSFFGLASLPSPLGTVFPPPSSLTSDGLRSDIPKN